MLTAEQSNAFLELEQLAKFSHLERSEYLAKFNRSARKKAYYLANLQKIKEWRKQYYQANRERFDEYQRIFRRGHRERYKRYARLQAMEKLIALEMCKTMGLYEVIKTRAKSIIDGEK